MCLCVFLINIKEKKYEEIFKKYQKSHKKQFEIALRFPEKAKTFFRFLALFFNNSSVYLRKTNAL